LTALSERGLPALLLERPGVRLPTGTAPAGTSPEILVGAPSPHPSDVVEVVLRRDRGRTPSIRAVRDSARVGDPIQWYRALLPPIAAGAVEEYRVVLSRAGRLLATLPNDGTWLSLMGVSPPRLPEPRDSPTPDVASQQRFGYDLEFFAALTVDLRAEILGATPDGYRINFFVMGGYVRGPRIDAAVQPQGGDWMFIRSDGIGAARIKITYLTSDGALILEEAAGVFDLGPNGYAKAAAGDFTGSPPFYATPIWSTAHPNWQWLNRCQGFGIGRVVMEKLQVQCDLYLPTVGERLSNG
jgi:hypothetical protein